MGNIELITGSGTDDSPGDGTRHSLLDRVVEALVFAADDPVTTAELARVYSDVSGEDAPSPDEVQASVRRINAIYESTDRSLRIRSWAGGFRHSTVQELAPYVRAMQAEDRSRKLTKSLLETVAVLAYRQPATKPEVEMVRGVNCDYALRRLLEYGLIDVVGRSDSIGRPLLYGTTDRFLDLFGLHSVSDLPNLREIEEILDDPGFQKERARLLMSSGLGGLSPVPDDEEKTASMPPEDHDVEA